MFVGIDWASEEHEVFVSKDDGGRADGFRFAHTQQGFDELVRRLGRHGEPADVPVAIERPDGRLVDRLLEAGHPVFPVKTNAIKAWRESEVVSGAKSDAGDAEVIADYLRIRRHRLRALDPFSDATKALRAVVRARTDLVEQRVAAANQLTATLDAFWPGAKAMFSDITCNIALTFLETYPTPAAAAPLGEGRMAAFLKKHGYTGQRSATELVERLRAAPAGVISGSAASAQGDVVLAMVRVIRALNQSIKDLDRSLNARLDEHPDAAIFTSLPRSGRINAAQMLAEWGDSRQAYDSPGAIAALSGAAPVTKRSGKHHVVSFRWACNKRLRNAFATFADNSRHASPWAADVYARARARGHDHPHAIRILARAWIRIIWRCWIDQVPYDPTRHGAARAFAERDPATGAAA